ncbi:YceI family protein [Aureibacter tunicatorum]|uniref:Polyisoprenoid-binding protein YceI n=1 Tax=Aureibacter tunicatorum TaxID=866807 RepID=A0AAE3XL61_9BACT|nr:YceI family protein [Aureibacter tunicatorum]MDR6238028.1 polyisoprenoid-binding protein YceI [Aureibacter tunicatorum]BDD03061.1 hypothetical protein AUTU_05440 [Aureibacter tunicatorum]
MRKKIALIILCAWGLLAGNAQAQKSYESNNGETKVIGTSTLHDWECVSETSSIDMLANVEDGQLSSIESLVFQISSESLKSGKKSMDKNVYDALKTKKHKTIDFKLTEVKSISGTEVKAEGVLTIAGASKNVVLNATVVPNANGVDLKTSYTFNMSDFGIDPPTAMLNTIKTGDEVTVEFSANLK